MPIVDNSDLIRVNHKTDERIVDGEHYDLYRELNVGQAATFDNSRLFDMETANMFNPQVAKSEASERMNVRIDSFRVDLAKVTAYLAAWSHSIPVTMENVKKLDSVTFDVLLEAIEQLEDETDEKRVKPKKGEQDPKD